MFIDSARRLGVEPRLWFYRNGGRIVGQMGSIPVRLKVGDEERHTGWLVETMVLKEYRGHAVGSRLMVEAHEEQPFSLSLGQTAEMREIQFRLGWQQVAPLQTADDLKGVAVWMFRNADDIYRYRRAFLVDLVAPLSDASTLRQLIRAACVAAAAGEADALLCHHIDVRLTDALRDCGFRLRRRERFLLVDLGTLSDHTRDRVLSAANWFVTQGDSDIDRPW
jgi:GNAT superfamily N-acetyltransferase